jgi:hypothetical protein
MYKKTNVKTAVAQLQPNPDLVSDYVVLGAAGQELHLLCLARVEQLIRWVEERRCESNREVENTTLAQPALYPINSV